MPPGAVLERPSVLDQLVKEYSEMQQRQKGVVSTTPAGPLLHGPNGLWSYPGLERPVISTRIKPRGIAGMLPATPSNVMNPIYPFFTGFTDPSESQPNGVCDDPPTAGQTKNCFQTATFGRYSYQSRVLDLSSIGQIINRSEFTDLYIVNDPLGLAPGSAPAGLTWPSAAGTNLSINNEVKGRFAEVGIKFQNKLMNQLWDGNPANNTGGGGYKEFPGLNLLIKTGIRDTVTGQTCPSMDSTIVNFNYKKVTDSSGNDNLVNVLTYYARILSNTAERMGLTDVRWVIAMRESLFYEVTAIWPCNYLTYRCVTMNGVANLDVGDAIAMRDQMRQGSYLVIDGARWDVVLDDAIDEETSGDTNRITNGCFASDVYFLPLSASGIATLYWEYFAWNGPNAMLAAETVAALPLMTNYYWSDGGQYAWHFKPPANWCVQWMGMIVPRLVLRTPFLAARIQHVQYCPLVHPRDAFPDDPYFLNGGVQTRATAPSLYNSW